LSRQHLLIAAIIMLGIAGMTFWFLNNFELREEDIPTGYQGEAKTNPWFAARLFLKGMGIPAHKIDMPELNKNLPPKTATLIITTKRGTLDEKKSQRLLDWVNQGGHLMVRALEPEYYDPEEDDKRPPAPTDPLLDLLNIWPEYHYDAEWDDDLNTFELTTRERKQKEVLVDFIFNEQLKGEQKGDLTIAGFNGPQAIHRKLGKGAVTVTSQLDFITNYSIGENDHAETFWELVHWHNNPGDEVYLLHNDDMPPLWELLWRHTRTIIVALGLILLLWIMKGFFRFGPLLPQPAARRRSLLEHIEASGRFFWKDNQQNKLVSHVRQNLQRRLSRIHPGWADLNEKERETHLAELLQLPTATIHMLLHDESKHQPQDFTRLIRQLENIRKQL